MFRSYGSLVLPVPVVVNNCSGLLIHTRRRTIFLHLGLTTRRNSVIRCKCLPNVRFPTMVKRCKFMSNGLIIRNPLSFIVLSRLKRTLFSSRIPLVFKILLMDPCNILLPPDLAFLRTLLPTIRGNPQRYRPYARPRVTVPTKGIASLGATICRRIRLKLMLGIRKAGNSYHVRTIWPMLLNGRTQFPITTRPGKLTCVQRYRVNHFVSTTRRVRVRRVNVMVLANNNVRFNVDLLFGRRRIRVQLFE